MIVQRADRKQNVRWAERAPGSSRHFTSFRGTHGLKLNHKDRLFWQIDLANQPHSYLASLDLHSSLKRFGDPANCRFMSQPTYNLGSTRPFLLKSDLQLAMAVKYWYLIQIELLNNDLRFVVVLKNETRIRPYFIHLCVSLVFTQI